MTYINANTIHLHYCIKDFETLSGPTCICHIVCRFAYALANYLQCFIKLFLSNVKRVLFSDVTSPRYVSQRYIASIEYAHVGVSMA